MRLVPDCLAPDIACFGAVNLLGSTGCPQPATLPDRRCLRKKFLPRNSTFYLKARGGKVVPSMSGFMLYDFEPLVAVQKFVALFPAFSTTFGTVPAAATEADHGPGARLAGASVSRETS